MTQLKQTSKRQYKPIKPKGFLQRINPYWRILKYSEKNLEKNPIMASLAFEALVTAPGGILYFEKEFNNVQREVCHEQGRRFVKEEFNDGTTYLGEIAKFPLAWIVSGLVSKLIF